MFVRASFGALSIKGSSFGLTSVDAERREVYKNEKMDVLGLGLLSINDWLLLFVAIVVVAY